MREGRHAVEGFGELKSNQTDTSYCDTLSLPTRTPSGSGHSEETDG